MITLPPEIFGGVRTIARLFATALRRRGHGVTVAFPATRGHRPELNSHSPFARPRTRAETVFGDIEGIAVGTRFPELEYTYSKPSRLWRELIDRHDRHVVVSGTLALAAPLAQADVPHFAWCASDAAGDRKFRWGSYSRARRILDQTVVLPKLEMQEAAVLAGRGRIASISPYTKSCLTGRRERPVDILPIPTDTGFFKPLQDRVAGRRLGFAGRASDPRKNIGLLLDAVQKLLRDDPDIHLTLTGTANPDLAGEIARRDLGSQVSFAGNLDAEGLRSFYRNLDAFLITSHQEGHAIVGVEAMACGVPVISTRCGGPEGYVDDGINGYLCDFSADEIAARVREVCGNETRWSEMSDAARLTAETKFSDNEFNRVFDQIWRETFGDEL